LPATEGRFVSGALAVAVNPRDVNHLLLATDSGLLRSLNGGRDWVNEAPSLFVGPVFAAVFDADGQRALASTALGMFRTEDGQTWSPISSPGGALPARAIVSGALAGRAYLAGRTGLWRSDDWGRSWVDVAEGLPEPVNALVVRPGAREAVYVVAGGRVWTTADGGRAWEPRDTGLPEGVVEAVAADAREPDRLWAAGADHLYRSDDRGGAWRAVGQPLEEAGTVVHGIAVAASGREIVLTTHRGAYRSADGGGTWEQLLDTLPAHLEAGPLVRDPADPATLYAGFSLTPYGELMRMAAEGETLLHRLDAVSLAGSAAFLVMLGLGGYLAVRWLTRRYRTPVPAAVERARAGQPGP
jgi:photosystem II stability/assembly factor-like uncharacterized protein